MYNSEDVSTILVIGGSGEYLSMADSVYLMEDYHIYDVTMKSKRICLVNKVMSVFPIPTTWTQYRRLDSEGFTSYPEGCGSEKLEVSEMGFIFIGDERINVSGLHDIITRPQLDALGFMLRYIEMHNNDKLIEIEKQIDALYSLIEREGLDVIFSSYFDTTERFLDLPRKQELKAVINRMRRIRVKVGNNY